MKKYDGSMIRSADELVEVFKDKEEISKGASSVGSVSFVIVEDRDYLVSSFSDYDKYNIQINLIL